MHLKRFGFLQSTTLYSAACLSILTFCITAGLSNAPEADSPATSQSAEEASDTSEDFSESVTDSGLQINSQTIDFGAVYEGTIVSHSLLLRNTAPHSVEVVGVNASCGCTTVDTEAPFTLKAGEERSVKIQLNTSNNVGQLEKHLTVFVHEKEARFKFPIALHVLSQPIVEIDQTEIDFGMVKATATASRDIIVSLFDETHRSSDDVPVHIATQPEGVSAKLTEIDAFENAARQWKLTLTVDGQDIPEESLDGDLIVMTPSTVEPIVRIPVRARQHSYVSCEPAQIAFGVIRNGSATDQTVQIRCLQKHRYDVQSVTFPEGPDFLNAEYDQEEGCIHVSVNRQQSQKGFFKALLQVRYFCDDGQRQSLVVPVSGYQLASR
jgi:hypothetical protein